MSAEVRAVLQEQMSLMLEEVGNVPGLSACPMEKIVQICQFNQLKITDVSGCSGKPIKRTKLRLFQSIRRCLPQYQKLKNMSYQQLMDLNRAQGYVFRRTPSMLELIINLLLPPVSITTPQTAQLPIESKPHQLRLKKTTQP